MPWSIPLGPTNQHIPDGLWEEFRNKGWIFYWDVHCKSYGSDTMNAYRVSLRRWSDGVSKPQFIEVGHTIQTHSLGRPWNAFGSGGWRYVDGFGTRRAAIAYMLDVQGFQPRR